MANGSDTLQQPGKLEMLYNYLKGKGKVKVQPTYQEFEVAMRDDKKLQKLHTYLQQNPKTKVDDDFGKFKSRLYPVTQDVTTETPPYQEPFDKVQQQLDAEGVVQQPAKIISGEQPTPEEEQAAKDYVMSVGKQPEMESNPLVTMGKTAWNLMRYQLPAAMASTVSLIPSSPGGSTGFGGVQTPGVPEFHHPTKKEHQEVKALVNKAASELQRKGAKLTENLVNTLDKVEDPIDAINWTVAALTQAGVQIPLSVATAGGSSFGQEIGSIYMQSVDRIAQEKGITPEEVIKQGLDEPAVAVTYGAAAGALDLFGARKVMQGLKGDVLKQSLRNRALTVIGSGAVIEPTTEYFQTWLEQLGEEHSAGKDFDTAVKDLLISSEKRGERREATAQGLVGGGAGTTTSTVAKTLINASNKIDQEIAQVRKDRQASNLKKVIVATGEAKQAAIKNAVNDTTQQPVQEATPQQSGSQEQSQPAAPTGDNITTGSGEGVTGVSETAQVDDAAVQEDGDVVESGRGETPGGIQEILSEEEGELIPTVEPTVQEATTEETAAEPELKSRFINAVDKAFEKGLPEGVTGFKVHFENGRRTEVRKENGKYNLYITNETDGSNLPNLTKKQLSTPIQSFDTSEALSDYVTEKYKENKQQYAGNQPEQPSTDLETLREQLLNSPEDLQWQEGNKVTILTEKGAQMLRDYQALKNEQQTGTPARTETTDEQVGDQQEVPPTVQESNTETLAAPPSATQRSKGQERVELGKQKVAKSLESLAAKLGATKQVNPLDDSSVWEDVKGMVEGLADMGIGKTEQVIQYLKDELGKYGVKPEDIDAKLKDINKLVAPKPEKKKVKKAGRQKSLLTRAHTGENPQKIKNAIAQHGLTYEIESHDEAKTKAKGFINDVGLAEATKAVKHGEVRGAPAAFIWAQAIDDVHNRIAKATDEKEVSRLNKELAGLMDKFDVEARVGGQFISALQEVYLSSDFNYTAERQIEQYKAVNKGVIPSDVEAKFRDLEKQFKEATKKLKEAEEKNKALTDDENFMRISQQFQDERKQRQAKVKTKKQEINQFFDSIKVKDVKGTANDITRVVGAAIWNGAVDAMRTATMAGYDLANVIQAGIDYIQKNYKGSDFKPEDFTKQVEGKLKSNLPTEKKTASVTINDGQLSIPESLLRKLIEDGAKSIDDLVSGVKEFIEDTDITDRQIRDAITRYGQTKNLSQGDVSKKLREYKRVGKLLSQLEDVQNKIRPLRSGLQRDKLTDQERRLQAQVKDAMKDLPVDEADLERQLKTSLDAIKSRLRNQIKDLEDQLATGKKSPEKKGVEYDEEAKELKARRDELSEALRALEGPREIPLEEKINRAMAATQKNLEEYERRIKDNDLEGQPRKPPLSSPELDALKKKRDKAKETLKQMQDEAGLIDRKRLVGAKESVRKSIEEYQRRIREKDFVKKPKRQVIADDELTQLRAEKLAVKNEFDKLQYHNELENRTLQEKIIDGMIEAWGLTRALRATGELSFVLIQGGVLTLSHPIEAAKAFTTAMSHFASEKRHEDWLNNVKSQDYYDRAKASKLAITEPNVKLTAREEIFLGGWVNHIWDVTGLPFKLAGKKAYEAWRRANPAKAIERAGIGYLNTLRLARYLQGEEMLELQGKTFKDNPEDFKNMADVINTFTGRASLGAAERMAKPLSIVFFSPRNWASIMKQATPWAFYHFGKMGSKGDPWYKPSVAQKMAMGDYMRYTALTGSILALVAATQDEEDEDRWRIELDPRSSDFMKLRKGNTTVDPWGGRSQMVVLQARLWTNAIKNYKGEVNALGQPYKTATKMDLLMRMVKNKLAPSSGLVAKYLESRTQKIGDEDIRVDAYGKMLSMEDELVNNLYPIYWETLGELWEDQPTTVAGYLSALAFFGMGTQTFDPVKERKENREQMRELRRKAREANN